jgi:chromosome segregation protein
VSAPARLLALRLQGFKSFAERTVVEFGPGISAVVGPNGSGKSNLADALRWALGEQGRALRSRKSEDVIFAGSDRRAALGMADVTLVLDNEDGLLPIEYRVLELGRRLYRSGENDYLLNKQRVRLRDLVELLDSAHLADNAFLFIGQGMVDQALALRPEERRPLFEEVAGVRRHERRRRKAEEQLAEAEGNLARVDDILAELRPQARRLAAQAEQQVTRASAGDELATALVAAAHGRWHDGSTRHTAAAERLTRARAEADRATGELAQSEAAAAALSAALGARADAERVRREAYEVARSAHTQLQLREARLASDLAAMERDRERLQAERVTAESDLALRRREAARPAPAPDADLEAAVAEAEHGLAEALEEVGGLRAVRQARGDEVATVRRAEAARLAELETARRRVAEAERRATEERAESDRSAADLAGLEERRMAAAGLASDAREAERKAVADRKIAREAADRADGAARAAAEAATATGSRAASLRGRLDAVRARLAEDEARGIARAARRVGGRRLDEELQVEPAFRAAVEAALGEVARAYLVDRGAVAGLASERGTVVVDERTPAERTPAERTPAERASANPAELNARLDAAFADRLDALGGGILVEAIRRDPLGPARRVLDHVAWVPDLAGLLKLQPHLPAGWSAVTRDGSALAGPIAIALGRAEGPLERRAELDRLEVELVTADAEASERERSATESSAAADAARLGLDAARATEAEAAAARRAADEAERASGRAAENVAREAAWQHSQAERAEREATRLREVVANLEAAAADRSAGLETAVAGEDDRSALAVWEARAVDLRARRDRVAAQLGAAEAIRRDVEAGVARALAAAAYDEQRITRAEADERALAERETAAITEREQVAVELAAAAAREAAALTVLDELRSADAADRGQLRTAEAAATAAREGLRAADDRVRSAEVAELEARLGLDAIREQVLVELAGIGAVGVHALRAAAIDLPDVAGEATATRERSEDADGPDDTDGPEGDVEAAELEAVLPYVVPAWEAARPASDPPTPSRLASLRRRFHELGAANPFAVEEYAELRARVASLEGQGTDLRAAIARTRTLIEELSTLISDQFQATFRALESAFDGRFKQLFGGGFARLELTDPADLASTGVEIVARPPGKKAQALAMLSGGERALTAVALLFAMLEVRPVPFCVLDEVDAALDEANVGRFSEALRSLAAGTQFIVITHNRGTIEAADALYGVTVGDDSISRVISLRLDEATAIAAKAGGNGIGALDPVGG